VILFVIDTAESFKDISKREIKKVPTLRGKTVITLFYEPSTRTRTSFEIAAKRRSADTITISSSTSSATKGESLKDTARNLESMRPDAIVIRHGMPGAPHMLAVFSTPVSSTEGTGPTSTPRRPSSTFPPYATRKGHRRPQVVIVGDIATAGCPLEHISLKNFGNEVICCGPPP
jgi:aspartate carbamoyltransferase catalytic subunit